MGLWWGPIRFLFVGMHKGSSSFHEFTKRKQDFDSVLLLHEKRVSNADAHNLSKAATTLSSGHPVWSLNTPDISCIPTFVLS